MDLTHPQPGWTIENWRLSVSTKALTPSSYSTWWAGHQSADPAWIHRATPAAVAEQLEELWSATDASSRPLCGVPVAVKDNIDVRGWPTTAACPKFVYTAEADAHVVHLLRQAGAIIVGKTNLDQFATGLVGTRSPYGAVPNAFNEQYISGGSSSGSASVVARGIVPIALGTDTAGSGRVPAAFNQLVGWKPTRGLFSTRGVVPACRTLDCVSIFALTVADAATVAKILSVLDPEEPYGRPGRPADVSPPGKLVSGSTSSLSKVRLGVPEQLEFFGDEKAQAAFQETLASYKALGAELRPIDFSPFSELARLLYASTWVAERALVAGPLLDGPSEWLDPTVRTILKAADSMTAKQAFSAEYNRAELALRINRLLEPVDALVVPTTPTIYRRDEVLADPLGTNARLGTYTNFTNLADLCGLALPGHFRADGLPSGVTLLGRAFTDQALARLGHIIQTALGGELGATGRKYEELPEKDRMFLPGRTPDEPSVQLAVVGAHLSGMALNHQLTARGGTLAATARTSATYRLYALPSTTPEKPGLMRAEHGASIEVEVWELGQSAFGSFVDATPPPLGIGNIELEDGTWVKGFICEPYALQGAVDITEFGGFRAYLSAKT